MFVYTAPREKRETRSYNYDTPRVRTGINIFQQISGQMLQKISRGTHEKFAKARVRWKVRLNKLYRFSFYFVRARVRKTPET